MKNKRKFISALILFLVLIITSVFIEINKGGDLFIYYLDVGQGDSALIEAPNGIQVLIDAGRGEQVIDELEKIIPFWDKKIDLLILSHGDLDHIGGFFDVLDNYKVEKIVRSTTKVNSDYEIELLEKAKNLGVEIQEIKTGDKIILDQNSEVYIETFWPLLRQGYEGQAPESGNRNENSLVLELIHGENEFLFTGDANFETEAKLIENFSATIDSDVLKVGHHGSKTSTSQFFLDKVSPQYSILSYGENSYGHPNSETLERLGKSEGLVFKTKEHGTIVVRSNGQNIKIDYLSFVIHENAGIQIFINNFITSIPN